MFRNVSLLLLAPLVMTGCVTTKPVDPYYSPCKAISTRDWTAVVAVQKNPNVFEPDATTVLVTGTVTVPTGGYELAIEGGPLVQLKPPVQQVLLRTNAPDGMATQAIVEEQVSGRVPFDRRATSVAIRCGDATVASVPVTGDLPAADASAE
ncbi:MAG TPA: hypothetical protein VF655_00365 [Allosphingosinicella sp.]|jgi:hypothetical protein